MHVFGIFTDVRACIGSDHRHFSRIAAVELVDKFFVPISNKAMMAIKLKLVGLVSEVFLNHDSGAVAVPGLVVRNV